MYAGCCNMYAAVPPVSFICIPAPPPERHAAWACSVCIPLLTSSCNLPTPPSLLLPPSQARQRLQLQLEQKDAQLGKLRGLVRELEGKLIDAYKRQADL